MQIRRKLTGALLALLALCAGQSFDPQHRVVISNPKIRALLGPMIASGHNPWSCYDNRSTRSATLQFSLMDKNYPNVWDKPARGSISVKQGSENEAWVKTLVASYQNDTVKAEFDKVYKGTGQSAY